MAAKIESVRMEMENLFIALPLLGYRINLYVDNGYRQKSEGEKCIISF